MHASNIPCSPALTFRIKTPSCGPHTPSTRAASTRRLALHDDGRKAEGVAIMELDLLSGEEVVEGV